MVAFPLPVAAGYWLHERWTFASNAVTVRRLGLFLALQVLAFACGLGLLVLFVSGLHWNPIVARIVATPIGPLATYLIGRSYIFSAPHPLDSAAIHDGAR